MKKSAVITIIVIVVVIGGIVWWSAAAHNNQVPAAQNLPAATDNTLPPATDNVGDMVVSSTTSVTTTVTTVSTSTTAAPMILALSTVANDEGATPQSFTVKAGMKVALTFSVNQTGTYHGGLDFRSSVINSGTIVSGQSGTVTFTATKSFSFTPYWPASNIAKGYTINIIVQ